MARLGEVIAERTFELIDEGGGSRRVVLKFGAPRPFDDGRDFLCPFQLQGLGSSAVRVAAGVDDAQALRLAMHTAATILLTHPAYLAGRLRWRGERDLGLPFDASLDTRMGETASLLGNPPAPANSITHRGRA